MEKGVIEANIVRTSPALIREGIIPASIGSAMSMVEVDTLDCVKSDAIVVPVSRSPSLLGRPVYREITYSLYELKYSCSHMW